MIFGPVRMPHDQYLGIDFAERHSAAVCVDEVGTVLFEDAIDFGPMGDDTFLDRIEGVAAWWASLQDRLLDLDDEAPVYPLVIFEDIYPGVNPARSQMALRLGGIFAFLVWRNAWAVEVVNPRTWKVGLGYEVKAGINQKAWARETAEMCGYTAGQTLGKTNAKQREDLTDAFLIAHWARTKEMADAEGAQAAR